jgi:hypothetical protein
MGLFRTLAVAAIGYYFGEKRGEKIGQRRERGLRGSVAMSEHSGRVRTVAGRRIFDDTAPGWNDDVRRRHSLTRLVWMLIALVVAWAVYNDRAMIADIAGRGSLLAVGALMIAVGVIRLAGLLIAALVAVGLLALFLH